MSEVRVNNRHPSPAGGLRSSPGSGSDEGGAPGTGAGTAQGPDPGAGTRSGPAPVQEGRSPSWVPEAVLDEVEDAAHVATSAARAKAAPRSKRPIKPRKDSVVATRLDDEELEVLDGVCSRHQLSRSQALRKVVKMMGADDDANISAQLEAQRPIVVRVDPGLLRQVMDALAEVSRRYGERAREIRAIGNNVNQIARVVNAEQQSPDVDAVFNLQRVMEGVLGQMVSDAKANAKALRVLNRLRA